MVQSRVITIRAATTDDAEALAAQRSALFQELGQHARGDGRDLFAEQSAEAFRRNLGDGTCHAWLATSAGVTIGSIALLVFPRLPSPASFATQEGYLLNVYTEPAFRGQGLATALVAMAIKSARALGLARIRLHATAKGEPVYAAAGFRARTDEMELKLE